MSRKDPSYRKHKASGQAIVTIPDGVGGRKDFLLGPYRSKESKDEYQRLIAQWRANGFRLQTAPTGSQTINELVLAFWNHVEQRYPKESRERQSFKLVFRPLVRLFGDLTIREFGPRCLKTLQRSLADGSWMTPKEVAKYKATGRTVGQCRNVVNRNIGRIRCLFKWGESEEMVPAGHYHALKTVAGLPMNDVSVRQSKARTPATWEQVKKIIQQCKKPDVAAMIELQWWTGMRSCEIRLMRWADIDQTNPQCWVYRPRVHKNTWRGQERSIPLGPKCITLLAPLTLRGRAEPNGYLFRPSRWSRQTECYRDYVYAQVVRRAAKRAGIDGFHPYAMRHGAKMRIEAEAGAEVARCVLGHKSITTTTHYGKLDTARAMDAMSKIG